MKIKAFTAMAILLVASNCGNVLAGEKTNDSVKLRVDTDEVVYNVEGKEYSQRYDGESIFIDENGRIQVPLGFIQNITAEPTIITAWNADEKTVELSRAESKEVILRAEVGSKLLQTYEGSVQADVLMDCEPIIKNDRVFIPLRYALNAVGVADDQIKWNGEEKIVEINKPIVYYSEALLDEKYELLNDNWDMLNEKCGLTGFSCDYLHNTINVYANEWSEEGQKYIKEFLGIEHIAFGIDGGIDIND